eukprot:TRINITY_DN6909_c0_g1_i1.p4 TRINITY_DN6909_c0_g1~~TRINITY_DN6909_c0_g1_i1.p4  ORF type:complete len:128 (+),score=25.65 TRINITY_DN6909_c0_g1_i1:901-1284(+)
MNISQKQRETIKNNMRQQMQKRVLTGKKEKLTPEEKEIIRQNAQEERDRWEQANLGQYEKIYPLENDELTQKYSEFIEHAFKMWQELTGANIRRNTKKIIESAAQQDKNIPGGKPMWNSSTTNTMSI